MKFYGQERLLREVRLIEEEIRLGNYLNLMLVAPSGWGKTTLAYMIINRTVGIDNAGFGSPPEFWFDASKPINFLDEIHKLATPEVLYSHLDTPVTTTILATNMTGDVSEPLLNRCIPLIFDPYTVEDLTEMVLDHLKEFGVSYELGYSIAERAKLNPRVAKQLCKRLNYVFHNYGIPSSTDILDELIESILDIDSQGLNPMDRRYLEELKKLGGRGSLQLLQYSLHLSKDTIVREIEPSLVHLGLIRITSRGRELINGS